MADDESPTPVTKTDLDQQDVNRPALGEELSSSSDSDSSSDSSSSDDDDEDKPADTASAVQESRSQPGDRKQLLDTTVGNAASKYSAPALHGDGVIIPSADIAGEKEQSVSTQPSEALVKISDSNLDLTNTYSDNSKDIDGVIKPKDNQISLSGQSSSGPSSPPSDDEKLDDEKNKLQPSQSGPSTPPEPEPEQEDNDVEQHKPVEDKGSDGELSSDEEAMKEEHETEYSNSKMVKPSTSIEHTEDNIELDYDIDLAQDISSCDLAQGETTTTRSAAAQSADTEDTERAGTVEEKQEDGDLSGDGEKSKAVKKTAEKPAKQRSKVKKPAAAADSEEEGELLTDSDGELTTTDDEGAIKDETEEGEIPDGRNFNSRTLKCRFFTRGLCTWGYNCRFLHPGVNDKGNYQLIERPGMRPPPGIYRPPSDATKEEEEESVEEPVEEPPMPPEPPKPETPWERGLRQAKEALKRASRKKEMELDIEDKKMNMTLDDVKNKDAEQVRGDPYYDNLQYDELDPIQATAFEEYNKDDNWEKAGFEEETFEVEWTQANYDLPHMQPPPAAFDGDWRDDRMRQDPPRMYDRGGRQRYRSPPRSSSRRDYRERPSERQGLHRQALGAEGWVDPWQRVKPGERRRTRRRSSSGSSSFSSLSGSSRHSSSSPFSSRSRSRTRTPTPLRNVTKPKSFIAPANVSKPDDKKTRDQIQGNQQDQRPLRKGPEWPSGQAANGERQSTLLNRNKPEVSLDNSSKDKYLGTMNSASRPSRKDMPAASRKDRNKFKRHSSSGSSSSSSSGSSSSRSHSSSSSGSSDSSSSSGSSSDDSSSSDSSGSDSDDIYGGMSKPKKEKRKAKKTTEMVKRPRPPLVSNKPPPVARKSNVSESTVRETTTSTSKAGIKLTLVNKTKIPSKKRVLDSPPPEELPPSKRANIPMPERVERPPKTIIKAVAMVAPAVKTKPAAAPTKASLTPTPKPVSKPPAKPVAKPAAKPAVKPAKPAPAASKKSQPNRREELLKQLKAVEEAIAKKRSKT